MITVQSTFKEDTAYDKWILFTYKGEEYNILLHWDKFDGFDIHFTDPIRSANWVDTPSWATDWEEGEGKGDSLAYTLDCLSDEVIEGSYV